MEKVDFVILTALQVECQAVIDCLDRCEKIQNDNELTYYHGYIHLAKNESYEVIVYMLLDIGNVESAVMATQIIQDWQPPHLIMVGIAGGILEKGVKLEDIVVAKNVFYYELAKVTDDGGQFRPKQFPCDLKLLNRCQHLPLNSTLEKKATLSTPLFGDIASGEKVIASSKKVWSLCSSNPEIKAIAMEGAGVARAVLVKMVDDKQTRFIEIRGISDYADANKNDDYQEKAAKAAANFTIELLRSRPFSPVKTGLWSKLKSEVFPIFSSLGTLLQSTVTQQETKRQDIKATSDNSKQVNTQNNSNAANTPPVNPELKPTTSQKTVQKPPSEKEKILRQLNRLVEQTGITKKLKVTDKYIPHDTKRLEKVKAIQAKLEQLSNKHPLDNQIFIALGCLYAATDDKTSWEEAKHYFSKVVKKSQNENEQALAAFNLFLLHMRHKTYNDSTLSILQKAIDLESQNYALHDINQYPIQKILSADDKDLVFLCGNHNPSIVDEQVVVKCFWKNPKGSFSLLFKEALTIGNIAEQYVPKPLACGYVDNLKQEKAFLVTEYICDVESGKKLLRWPKQDKLTLEESMQLGLEIAKALQMAHCARIYHLDLKPSNILIKRQNNKIKEVKIINFGLSHITNTTKERELAYSAPEKFNSNQLSDSKADIYSFGAVMYHFLSGKLPTPFSTEELPDIPALRNLLAKCVKRSPSQRPDSQKLVKEWLALLPRKDAATIKSNRLYKKHCILQGHNTTVYSLDFSPDGCTLASGSNDASIRLWNAGTGKELKKLTGHSQAVNCVTFSPDGRILASSSNDRSIKLWDIDTGKVLQTLLDHNEKVHSVVFNPTKCILVSAGYNKTILWKINNNTCAKWQELPGCDIATFNCDGSMLAVNSGNKVIIIELPTTFIQFEVKPFIKQRIDVNNSLNNLVFTIDNYMMATDSKNTISYWETRSFQKINSFQEPDCGICTIAVNNNDSILAVNSIKGNIKIWDLDSHKVVANLQGNNSLVNSVSFSSCGRFLAASHDNKMVQLWKLSLT